MKKAWARIKELLEQGVSPERLALCIALGVVLGVFPMLGMTTLLCGAAAVALRLNLPAIQVVNYAIYPLHLALILPLVRLGETVYRAPHLPLRMEQIRQMIHAGVWSAMLQLWRSQIHAITAWALVAPVAAFLLYVILVPVLRRVRYTSSPSTIEEQK